MINFLEIQYKFFEALLKVDKLSRYKHSICLKKYNTLNTSTFIKTTYI